MDIKTLYDANINNITVAKNAYDALFTAFGQHIESWQHEVVDRLTNSHWTGTASGHAHARIQFLGTELQAAKQELGLISKALSDAAEGIAAAQSHLISALDDAKTNKMTVAPDGRITWDNDPNSANYAGDKADATAQAISARITAALTEADHADQTISARLGHLSTNATNGTGLDAATAKSDQDAANALSRIPAAGTDPNSVKTWWNSLTDAQQQRMILTDHDKVGALDGIPAVARNQANLINLQRGKEDLQRQLDGLGPEPKKYLSVAEANGGAAQNPAYTEWKRKYDALKDKLKGVDAIEDRLSKPVDADHPPTYLLGFDTKGTGRAIIAVNNPDTADNVSTYVPGTGARVGASLAGDIERSDLMVASANAANKKAGDPSTTSSITWVGYEAPQSIVPEAAWDGFAKAAEKDLHNFETGLRATHEGKASNNTILAHSYGTTTVGYTLRDKGLPVDNVVLIASPGAGVEHARDLGVDPSHVFAAQGDKDAIKFALPEDPDNAVSNIVNNAAAEFGYTDNPDHHVAFGRDPSVPQFGARIIPTDPGTDHSGYWAKNSASLIAMGQAIAGKPIS
ncbi:alpha/beta hydrolase [Kitasatospora sp. NPDC086791]|uniref:alpha/beta hydrolase n=1 Tax=Kitasatospora sp. NPDC086791 TaxID=3155178 RepID=UPI003431D33E